ncbi:hypothetical protein AZE42_11532 [Rhizopogon vesiculosus]|uniref:Uncharacterized protein n=1 Tax=Rhizopogon vesiculosus TaxID=180088 RepID=A0A1J8PQV8_9AGAM|nr:hypothetical protein AZE42_11532 [Rhizopogon vesiculosus]
MSPTSNAFTFNVANPSPSLNGRAPVVSCGHCSSEVQTGMGYTRAPASDFDDWGIDGWESKNLIPLMKKVLECVVPGNIRGASRPFNTRVRWPYQGVQWWM